MTTPTSSKLNSDEICPICEGMLVVKRNVPVGHPEFGKVIPCVCQQDNLAHQYTQKLHQMSNLDAYADLRFENFQVRLSWLSPEQNQYLSSIAESCLNYAADPANQWLLLKGGFGTGKTHLAAAVGHHRLAMGYPVLFLTVPDLLDHLRQTYAPSNEVDYDELFERVKNVQLLVLDDLGSESPTAWANEKLFQLLNHRYVKRLATVITTNVDIEGIDPRLQSRLVDNTLVTGFYMDFPDYRRSGDIQERNELTNMRLYAHLTFEQFDFRAQALTPEVADNLRRAYEYARDFALNPNGWLMFLGGHGSGKTHLAAAIANHVYGQGDEVIFVTVADLLDYFRSAFSPNSAQSLDKRFKQIRNIPLLVLDHFQLQTATPWAREKLFQILDYRYLAQLPTVITKAGENVDDLDGSFKSRLLDKRICDLFRIQASDYRGGTNARRR